MDLHIPVSAKKFPNYKEDGQSFIFLIYDSSYFVGQGVVLQEYDRYNLNYSGKELKRYIKHIEILGDGYCILGLTKKK